MNFSDCPIVSIPNCVCDFLMINVNDESTSDLMLEYQIFNESDAIIRKGAFKGMGVQLRLSNLQDGNYKINMFSENKQVFSSVFKKLSV